jgi:hypothetical protein
MDQNLFDRIIIAFVTFENFKEFARGKAGLVIDIDAVLKHFINAGTDALIKNDCSLSYVNSFLRVKISPSTYGRKRKEFGLTNKKGI